MILTVLAFWQINSIIAFVLSAIFAGVLIPKILLIAFRKKLFDVPDERKIHSSTVPRLGGIAFEPVIFFCLFFLLAVDELSGGRRLFSEYGKNIVELSVAFCTMILLYLIGIADDLIGVKYRAKFVVQVICALFFVLANIVLLDLDGFLWLNELPIWFSAPLSVLLIVFIINAMNLIDGIDGLASGLSAVALLYYGMIFLESDMYLYALLAFSTLGTVVPFFYFNVFGVGRQKIFMGDTGSLTIGIILCLLSLKMTLVEVKPLGCNSLALAFAPLAVPCMDVIRVFFHRLRRKKSPFMPDKSHIHHKLLMIGMSQRAAMLSILLGSALCTLGIVFLSIYVNINIVFLLAVLAFTLTNCWLSKRIKQKGLEW